ncbi:hypothetical protein UT300012_21810 [Paraclostridium bifermentans]
MENILLRLNDNSITIGKSYEFYKSLNFSDEDIECMKEQESSVLFDYKKIVLDRKDISGSVYLLLEDIETAYNCGLPVCLLVNRIKSHGEFLGMCEAFARSINALELLSENYELWQIKILLDYGIDNNLIKELVQSDYYPDQIEIMCNWIKNGLDIEPILNKNIRAKTMNKLGSLLLAGMDIKEFWDRDKWDIYQLGVILDYVCEGLPIHRHITPDYDANQIYAIGKAIQAEIPLDLVIDISYDAEVILRLVRYIEDGFNIDSLRPLFNTKYNECQVEELAQGIKDGLDIKKFSDWRFEPRTMRNLRLIALEERDNLEQGLLSRDCDSYEYYDSCPDCDY